MTIEFDMLAPQYLFLFGILVVLFLFLRHTNTSRLLRLRAFGVTANAKTLWSVGAPLLVAGLIILAASRPYWGSEKIRVSAQGEDIMVIVDVSNSMLAADISPSRLEFAKHKLLDLINYLAKEPTGDRIGIVPFAGDSYLFCPLTADYGVLQVFVRALSTALISSGGSGINRAINRALESFRAAKVTHPRILLVTDGEDMGLDIDAALQAVQEAKVPVDVLGIGTNEGSPIKLNDGRFQKNAQGDIVVSKRDEKALKRIAYGSGGGYFEPRLDDGDLQAIFRKGRFRDQNELRAGAEEIVVYNELGPFMLWPALALLMAAWIWRIEGVIFSVALLFLTLGAAPNLLAEADTERSQSDGAARTLRDAAGAYNAGRYEEALASFQLYSEKMPEDRKVLQALASSHYKSGNYAEAIRLFDSLAKNAVLGRHKFEALYNLGNSHFMAGDYRSAISGYEQALAVKPKDKKTEYNLELARKLLKEQEQDRQEQEQDDSSDTKQSSEQSDQKEQSSGSSNSQSQEKQESSADSGAEEKPEDGGSNGREESEEKSSENGSNSQSQQQAGQHESNNNDRSSSGSPQDSELGESTEPADSPASQSMAGEQGGSNPLQGGNTGKRAQSEEELRESAAKAWLESLPDSPVLFQRKGGRKSPQEQSW